MAQQKPLRAWSRLPPEDAAARYGFIGKPIPGGEFLLLGDDNQPVTTPGTHGELIYHGENVAWAMPNAVKIWLLAMTLPVGCIPAISPRSTATGSIVLSGAKTFPENFRQPRGAGRNGSATENGVSGYDNRLRWPRRLAASLLPMHRSRQQPNNTRQTSANYTRRHFA